ncbi:MAG: prepilin peptidase [Nitrospinota bacterium]|nr:prepilin peptidase [Nitrospinota bacterium]
MQIYFFIIGASVGSFLNVVIHRLPERKSVVTPRSSCPNCGASIKPWNNIPLISYLLLRGRCPDCKAGISPRYPLVEFICALIFLSSYNQFGVTPASIVYMFFSASLIAITFIDLDHMIIPDVITLPGIPLGLLFAWLILPIGIESSVWGLVSGGALFFILALLVPGGMGGGDIKLIAMIGAFLGLKSVLFTIFLGSFIGSIVGITSIIILGKGRKTKIPFGPFLAIGALLSLFHDEFLTDLYLQLFVN